MKCDEIETIMIDYLDGKLESNRKEEIEKHLETCERCLDEFRDTQKVLELISKDEIIKPDESLRINFYHMLHTQISRNEEKKPVPVQNRQIKWYNHGVYAVAAGIALLICGTFTGIIIDSGRKSPVQEMQIDQLRSEVASIKKSALFTMLKDESSSNRIQALNYADEIEVPDNNIIEALVRTLNNDKNVNVRMAAAFALAKFADQQSVTDSLVKSLSLQVDPILQVTLISILVERKEKSALKTIQQILTNENTLEEVKSVAENGAKLLL